MYKITRTGSNLKEIEKRLLQQSDKIRKTAERIPRLDTVSAEECIALADQLREAAATIAGAAIAMQVSGPTGTSRKEHTYY